MPIRPRPATSLLIAFLAGTLLVACSGTGVYVFDERVGRIGGPEAEGALIYGAGLPIETLDPNGAGGWCELTALIHARPFTVNADGAVVEDLVRETTWSPDGRTVRLSLADATFHDGSPVRARDLAATFDRVLADRGAGVGRLLARVEKVQVVDSREVVLILSGPFPELPEALTEMAILPEGGDGSIGAGPYRLVERRGAGALLQAHDGWHGGLSGSRWIDLRVIPEDEARARALASGRVQLAFVPPENLELFGDRERFRVFVRPGGVLRAIPLDVQAPGLDDPRVRRALSLLIDRERIVARALLGTGRPASQFFPAGNPAHDPGLEAPSDAHPAALALLAEAGWTPDPDGRLRRDGEPLKVRLVAWQENAFRREAVASVVADWRAAGIEAEAIPVDHAGYTSLAESLHGRAEGFVGGWGTLLMPATMLARKFRTAGEQNRTGFSDPEVDVLLDAALAAPAYGERIRAVRAAQRRILELMPWIPLVHADYVLVAEAALTGLDGITVIDSWYEFPRLLPRVRSGP